MENKIENKKPVRIQRSRQHKQVSPNGLPIVYVGRGSRWGNPFRIVKYKDGKWAIKTDGSNECTEILTKNFHAFYNTKEEAAKDAVKCYKHFLFPYEHNGELSDLFISESNMKNIEETLKGKNISCWCKLNETCHADLLMEIANEV